MTPRARWTWAALAWATAALAGAFPSAAQVFRATVDAVQVDVLVTRSGRPVTGLTATDFELRDNGVVQTIDAVAVDDVPVTLVLVLDVSESVVGQPLEHLRAAVTATGEALSSGDRLSLITFSHRLTQLVAPTADIDLLRSAAGAVEAGGATALYDATTAALLMRPRVDGRTVVLLFSDGTDTVSWQDPRTVLTTAQRSDIVIYGVTLRQQVERINAQALRQDRLERGWFREAPAAFGRQYLPLLTEETGGSLLVAERTDALRDTFVRVVSEFKSRYILSYTPQAVEPGGWHAIDVRLKSVSGSVTARRGYLRGTP